jgi:hypothetical protein
LIIRGELTVGSPSPMKSGRLERQIADPKMASAMNAAMPTQNHRHAFTITDRRRACATVSPLRGLTSMW